MREFIIFGNLTNIKNQRSQHALKAVILEVEIAPELVERMLEVFGWPSLAQPVPVWIGAVKEGGEKPASLAEAEDEVYPTPRS